MKEVKLTRKQKAFADELIRNPKQSATKAVAKTYNTDDYHSQRVIASQNLAKPNILKYLDKYGELAEITAVDIMQNSRSMKDEPAHARVALDASKDILNRLYGTPTQKIESQSTTVTLNLSLKDLIEVEQG